MASAGTIAARNARVNARVNAIHALGKRPDREASIGGRTVTVKMLGPPTKNPAKGILTVRVKVTEAGTDRGIGKRQVRIEKINFTGPDITIPDGMGGYTEDPGAAIDAQIDHTLSLIGLSDAILKEEGNTTSVITIDSGAVNTGDGSTWRYGVDEAFATIIGGDGNIGRMTTSRENIQLGASATTDQFAYCSRLGFDYGQAVLDAIGSDTILSATASVYKDGGGVGLGSTSLKLVPFAPADPANYATSDYQGGYTRTSLSDAVVAIDAANGWLDFALNSAGITHLAAGGVVGMMHGWDFAQSFDGSWSSSALTFARIKMGEWASNNPKITVEHEATSTGMSQAMKMTLDL